MKFFRILGVIFGANFANLREYLAPQARFLTDIDDFRRNTPWWWGISLWEIFLVEFSWRIMPKGPVIYFVRGWIIF